MSEFTPGQPPDAFTAACRQDGFTSFVEVARPPNEGLASHTHPFEAKALILAGSIGITVGGVETVYRAGDVFHLGAGEPHEESYGPAGVRFLVARR